MVSKVTTIAVDRELHLRIRAAVKLVTRKSGQTYTAVQFAREAVLAHLAVIAEDYNEGRPIGPDDEPLPAGRPAGVVETQPRRRPESSQ